MDWPSDRGYLRFLADGTRVGFERLGIDSISEDWLFKPGSQERWVLGDRAVHLVGADGRTLRTIKRRPNGHWLETVDKGAVAPDGALAVTSTPESSSEPMVLNIYAPNGDPLRTIAMSGDEPFVQLAFDGSTVIVAGGSALYFYDVAGGAPRQAALPVESWWSPYLSPDGSEVWVHDAESEALLRYRLPPRPQ